MAFDPTTYLVQNGLKSLGFDPGALDGDNGPKTQAARQAWADSRLADKSAATPARASFIARLLAVAESQLHVRETSRNHGDGIAKYWPATNYPEGYTNREPYCAAGLCWCIREASFGYQHEWQLPTTAAAFGYDEWARDNAAAGILYRVTPAKAAAGDIVVYDFHGQGHVGLVTGRSAAGDLLTIEFNTGDANAREGDGVYRRTRSLTPVRSIHRFA